MTYCSKCALRLPQNDETCPLCMAKSEPSDSDASAHAASAPVETAQGGYPAGDASPALKKRRRNAVRSAGRALLGLGCFLAIMNALTNPGGIWAAYPVAAMLLLWMLWRLPRNFPKPRAAYAILLGEAGILAYVGMTAALTHGASWYAGYAAPLTVLSGGAALSLDFLIAKRALKKSYAPFLLNAIPGSLCLPAAILSGGSTDRVASMLALMFSAGSFLYIAYKGRRWLRSELRRKFFR